MNAGSVTVKLTPVDLAETNGAVEARIVALQVTESRVLSEVVCCTNTWLLAVMAVVLTTQVPVEALVAHEKAPAGAAVHATADGFAAVPAAAQFVVDAMVLSLRVVNDPAAAAVPPIAGGDARYVLNPVPLTVEEADKVVNAPVLALVPPIAPGEAKVAPFKLDAFRLGTFVVEATVNGAVPVV